MKKILILGPQGSGKGTQANILSDKLGIPALSMGQLLREEAASGSDLGQEIQAVIDAGNLVSDEITLKVLQRRFQKDDAQDGYILDGYPRNIEQKKAFETIDEPTDVLVITVPKEESIARLTKRAAVEQRSDDTEDVIKRRLEVYEQQTLPIIEDYRKMGIVKEISGLGTVEEIAQRVQTSLS